MLKCNVKHLLKDDKGQGIVEYGLIISFVVIVVMFTIQLFGNTIYEIYYSKFTDIFK